MKKFLSILLVMMMVLSVAACGNKDSENSKSENSTPTVTISDPLEILTTVWNAYGENDRFSVMGGDYTNSVSDAPGAFGLDDTTAADTMLLVPEASAALIDKAASLVHMMNANTFTCGAFHVKDAATVQTFVDGVKTRILNNQWMCGFPDTLIMVQVGNDYVVSAFGAQDLIATFKTKLLAAYEGSSVLVEENLSE